MPAKIVQLTDSETSNLYLLKGVCLLLAILLLCSLRLPNGHLTVVGWICVALVSLIPLSIITYIYGFKTIHIFYTRYIYCFGLVYIFLGQSFIFYTQHHGHKFSSKPVAIQRDWRLRGLHRFLTPVNTTLYVKGNSFYPNFMRHDIITIQNYSVSKRFKTGQVITAQGLKSLFAICIQSIKKQDESNIPVTQVIFSYFYVSPY